MSGPSIDGGTTPDRSEAGEPAHVLVVEDNAVNQLLISRQLARLGLECEIVGEASTALDLLSDPDHCFDVVLMDWQLPGIDGLEATRRIRELERESTRRVPVIALTASALASDRLACHEAGMDDFVAKPASITALDEAINRWVSPPDGRAAGFSARQ